MSVSSKGGKKYGDCCWTLTKDLFKNALCAGIFFSNKPLKLSVPAMSVSNNFPSMCCKFNHLVFVAQTELNGSCLGEGCVVRACVCVCACVTPGDLF